MAATSKPPTDSRRSVLDTGYELPATTMRADGVVVHNIKRMLYHDETLPSTSHERSIVASRATYAQRVSAEVK